MDTAISTLNTPCLLLDKGKMMANHARMMTSVKARAGTFRPHLKTVKSLDIAEHILATKAAPLTVSTLKEAAVYGRAGYKDILYAVALTPDKIDRVLRIRREGVDLKILIDSEEMAEAVAHKSRQAKEAIPTMIEIDIDGHRAGVSYSEPERLLNIARKLSDGAKVVGVMAHAGESYGLSDARSLQAAAVAEEQKAVAMAHALRRAGFECPIVSVGSTPTALSTVPPSDVLEIRAGVYLFFDLVQAGIGVCTLDDIALSVLATVNGRHTEKQWLFIDAGWTALSRDTGTATQATNQHYGLVCNEAGMIIPDLVVLSVNQEHGIVGLRPGAKGEIPQLPIGTKLRILPNHACATASQFDEYHVLNKAGKASEVWPRFRGW